MIRREWLFFSASIVLVAQAILTYGLSRTEYLPTPPPLAIFPVHIGTWQLNQEIAVDPDAVAVLGPDDLLSRLYRLPTGQELTLFLSYYKTQHGARNAHDPKVCLPGSGWNPLDSTVITIPVGAASGPVTANRYVVSRGRMTAVVVYWFQTHHGGVAQEQALKLSKILETIRERRTDMALVRIMVPAVNGDTDSAARLAVDFARDAYPSIARQFIDNSTSSGS